MNGRLEVTLMAEYGVDIPLWPQSQEIEDLVPPHLLQRLVRWQQRFDDSFHWERGWCDEATKLEWSEEAQALEGLLRDALPPDVVLTVDLWPLSSI